MDRQTKEERGHRAATWVAAIVGLSLTFALGGCTAITPETVKARESAGATRHYDRPSPDLYSASVAAVDIVRAQSNYWNRLEIVERDPAKGTLVAEQHLDSAVIPGVGTSDAIGIFVRDVPPGESDVTVVVLGSDQLPGSAGTSASSLPTASSVVFPAIDQALESIPVTPRTAAVVPAPSARAARAAPAPVVPAAGQATVLDRVYDTLRAGGSWRPLIRESRADGTEELRVGSWASLADAGDGRVLVKVRQGASATDAARLALELSQAGFAIVVESEAETHHKR